MLDFNGPVNRILSLQTPSNCCLRQSQKITLLEVLCLYTIPSGILYIHYAHFCLIFVKKQKQKTLGCFLKCLRRGTHQHNLCTPLQTCPSVCACESGYSYRGRTIYKDCAPRPPKSRTAPLSFVHRSACRRTRAAGFFFSFFFSGRHRHCRLGPMGNLPRVARVTTANPIRGPVNRFCELFAGPELVMLFRLSC